MRVNKFRKITFTIGIIFALLGVITMFVPGFNWAIDFTGGYETVIDIGKEFKEADVKAVFEETLGFKPEVVQKTSDADHDNMVTIKCKELSSEQRTKLFNAIVKKFDIKYEGREAAEALAAMTEAENASTEPATDPNAAAEAPATEASATEAPATETAPVEVAETTEAAQTEAPATETTEKLPTKTEVQISDENVDATIGAEMRRSAIIAALIALLLMLLYITFRFELLSGLVAIVMLFHDVMVVCGAYALLRIPVGSTFIAVLLTIVGYSINATIIIFDRIRENVRMNPKASFEENVDKSVAQTFTRSIYTTFTTLFTITALYFVGVDSIKEFALPIIVGLIAGVFSSVFLAGPLWTVIRPNKKQAYAGNGKKSKKSK